VPSKRNKRRKDDDNEPQLFYVQRTSPPEKDAPEATPKSEPEPMPEPAPEPEPPLPIAEKVPLAKVAKPAPDIAASRAPETPQPIVKKLKQVETAPPASVPIEAAPSTPEEAIPVLTAREPSNAEMSNPEPLGKVDEAPVEVESTPPPVKATTQRLGILKHDAPPATPPPKKSGAKKSTLIVSAFVMMSRLFGVVREQIFAFMFGASGLSDAFVAAFRIPNLLRDLFAEGALSTAFTTTFTKTWEKEGPQSAWHLARLVLSTLTFVLGIICLLGIFFAPQLVHVISGGFANTPGMPDKFDLTVRMTQLLFPFILFVSLAAAVMGILNSRHVFGVPASASTVFNIVSIVGGAGLAFFLEPQQSWSHPHFGERALMGWAFGALLGGLAQLAMQLPSLFKQGLNFDGAIYVREFFSDPALRTVLILMVPSAIAGSAVQINVAVNQGFASHINGANSWLYYAFRLVQLPIGIFGVAIATVTLPAVARQHALDDLKAFGKTVEEALRFGFYLTLPASLGLCAIAAPVIQLIYEHGTFTAVGTQQTALALQAYTIGLAGYSGIKILVPCFYAMQPPRFESIPGATFWQSFRHFVWNVVLFTPARVSLIGIVLNLVLCFVLYDYCNLGHVGLAMTTGFIAVLNFLQLTYAISKKINLGNAADWLSYFARVSLAALACGGTVLALDTLLLANRTTHSLLGAVILFANIGIAGAVYLGLTIALKVPESVELVNVIKRKFGRATSAK
jgi:putative peptidoglycan lipid II flippase